MKNVIIAIDGPAGSGKSTTARLVAERIGCIFIDTGAMYRAVTLEILRKRVDIHDEPGVATIAKSCAVEFVKKNGEQFIFLNGEDVSSHIRSAEVTKAVSIVSSYAAVRQKLVELQRKYAAQGSIVMDGRDIGTTVFPAADIKVYLSASLAERAKRRQKELMKNDGTPALDEIEKQLADRDAYDSSRALSPLRKAPDAIELDTTHMTVEEQVNAVVDMVRKKV